MSLHDLHAVFVSTQNACKSINACGDLSLPRDFKDLYANLIKNEQSFSRHNEAVWLANDILELHSRGNRTVTYIPSVFFFVAEKLVPLYLELQSYRVALVQVLQQYNHTLDDTEEPNCVQYINNVAFLSDEEKHWLCKFVTDGDWWGKGRQIKRAQDFYESPLMQSASLTQETQSEVARITKQFAENPGLVSKLDVSKNSISVEPSNTDRLTVALKLFHRQRAGDGCLGGETSTELMRQEFIDWCVDVDGKKEITPKTYLPPLESVSMPMEVESMKSSWNGVYEFVYGKKPAKHVLEIATAAELDEIYGEFLKVYAAKDNPMPEGVSAANWNKVRAWVKADKAKGRSSVILHESAFKKYRQFLEWRGANGVAKGGPNGWASYDAWAKAARVMFAKVDAGMLVAADFDYTDFARMFVYNPTVANVFFKDHEEDEKSEVGNFISQNRQTPKAASWYLEKDNLPKVKGLGVGCALNFMMKVRPVEFATYSPMIDKALMSVGLLAKPLPPEPTVESYEQCKALQGQILAKMHELKVGKAADDDSPADYLTVNEFAWWLNDEKNQNLIKEKVMESKMKDAAPTLLDDEKRKDLKLDPEKLDDILLLRLLASLRAKGFAILAGHSGTGKSRYVKKLACMTCNAAELRREGELPGNYLILQVKPNWHDSTELLGFRNAMDGNRYQKTALIEFLFRAYHFKDTPFFLCLDEMNLAPVEQYFAEFLSAMESEEPVPLNDITAEESNLFELGCEYKDAREYLAKNGFSIPKNLFIVGTVNMDETTNQFSRKVLDRAFTIEMTDVDFTKFGSVEKPSYSDTLKELHVTELLGGAFAADKLDEDDTKDESPLVKVQKALAETPFAIAYRFASEYTLLKRALEVFDVGEKKIGLDPLDQAVLMKVLPRIAGEADYIIKVYGEEGKDGLCKALEGKPVSLEKIKKILKRAKDTNAQYITFWP